MEEELDFAEIFRDLPQVLFPYDKSLPVKGWMMQGPAQQVVFWHSDDAYESAEHSHPYSEWGIVITGWCDISTPEGTRRYNAGDAFYLKAPNGLGQSDFANLIPRTLKVPSTARNWRTVQALLEMVKNAEG